HPVHIGAALAAVMVHAEYVDPAGADERRRAPRRDRLHHEALDVGLGGRTTGAGRVGGTAPEVARPEIIEPPILNERRDRAVVLVRSRNVPAADDLTIHGHERELCPVAERDLAPRQGNHRRAGGGGGRGGIPARYATRAER